MQDLATSSCQTENQSIKAVTNNSSKLTDANFVRVTDEVQSINVVRKTVLSAQHCKPPLMLRASSVHDVVPGKRQGRTWEPKATDIDYAVIDNPRNQSKNPDRTSCVHVFAQAVWIGSSRNRCNIQIITASAEHQDLQPASI